MRWRRGWQRVVETTEPASPKWSSSAVEALEKWIAEEEEEEEEEEEGKSNST